MKFKQPAKTLFKIVEGDQLPFMEIIIVKPSYPGALKSYNFVWNIKMF